MRFGDAELYVVSDGEFHMDGGGLFGLVPKVLWEQLLKPDHLNRVAMALNCLLVRSAGKTILVDTGLGSKLSDRQKGILGYVPSDGGGLLASLARLGVSASDVDIVINTHLHSDHCGGNTVEREGQVDPTFPRAEYWIQRREWAEAFYPNERTRPAYDLTNLEPIAREGQLRLVYGDCRVTKQVRCAVTRGHTAGHQSIVVEAGGNVVVYLGDLAPMAVHLQRLAYVTAYDNEPMETVESKRTMKSWMVECGASAVFAHDTCIPIGRLRDDEGKTTVEAVPWPR